ncbi:Cell death protease [Coemansia aciculifera]|uniref:Pheromone-processing carboxypeptidase KEX1 n=1 Tax=Coemansia aciculifera TaxID=417176 RepID=A0A9W8INX5_9FUNG|nr:Cell death protease [Coemansia aciculifera]KAJ2877072.1 Cell death protease [Coemansia aciculifera]
MYQVRDEAASANSTVPLPDKAEFAVRRIPFQEGTEFDTLEQYAGQLPVKSAKDNMFFWLVSNTTNTYNKDKLIIWLNGGPGCTSLDGVFLENGPYQFDGPNRLRFRDYSLSQQFDVLYIDQPYGTGFSVASTESYAKTYREATQTLLEFLRRFYLVFPELRQRQLYVAGESEAGTYIPYLAEAILKMPAAERFALSGLMIGNGWIDPLPMYMSYAEILTRHELLTPEVYTNMLKLMDSCAREFKRAPQPVHTDVCERIPMVFLNEGGPKPGMCYNMYDLRLTDTQPSCGMNWPSEIGTYTEYLNRADVQKSINVREAPAVWTECSDLPNKKLKHDDTPPASIPLRNVLNLGVPVLLFVGKEDYLCNYVGTEWSIGNMTWAGSKGFQKPVKSEWRINGQTVGSVESERGLTYALVYNASHMVGVDKPREILDVFTAFTNASAANLRFSSTFREITTTDVPVARGSELGKWLGLGFLLFLVLLFALCFKCRVRIFAWWKRGQDAQRLDGDGLVARRDGYDRMRDIEDDAFMMSEFTFAKYPGDVEGLLLDDGSASSPDEDMTVLDSRRTSRIPSPNANT